jgi:hypothetical protein
VDGGPTTDELLIVAVPVVANARAQLRAQTLPADTFSPSFGSTARRAYLAQG